MVYITKLWTYPCDRYHTKIKEIPLYNEMNFQTELRSGIFCVSIRTNYGIMNLISTSICTHRIASKLPYNTVITFHHIWCDDDRLWLTKHSISRFHGRTTYFTLGIFWDKMTLKLDCIHTLPRDEIPLISTKNTIVQQNKRHNNSFHTGTPKSSIPVLILSTSSLKTEGSIAGKMIYILAQSWVLNRHQYKTPCYLHTDSHYNISKYFV